MAELKPSAGQMFTAAEMDLHGFTAVAELKRALLERPAEDRLQISTASPPWPN